jgi:hypothetical protein
MPVAMQAKSASFDPDVRAAEKQHSRAADERAMVSGQKSVVQLKRENEVFASYAREARVDFSASRSLS